MARVRLVLGFHNPGDRIHGLVSFDRFVIEKMEGDPQAEWLKASNSLHAAPTATRDYARLMDLVGLTATTITSSNRGEIRMGAHIMLVRNRHALGRDVFWMDTVKHVETIVTF
jgi:hypothetical protein